MIRLLMTPRERFDSALEIRPVDRPPLFYQHLGAAKMILQHTGLTIREGFHDPETFAKLATAAHDLYGFDNVMAGWGDLLIEAQAHGMQWKFPEKDFYPRPAQYLDLGKVDGVMPVDPMKDRYWSVPLKAASLMQHRIGNKIKVMGCLDSPMLIASELIGMEQALMAEYNSPDLVHALVRKILGSCQAYGEEASHIGLDTIFMDNSSAGGELNSPEFCERFDHSHLRVLMDSFRAKGLDVVFHNDSVQPYLDMQLALKPKGLHFHLKSVDMVKTFDMLRGKTCVFAGIDHQVLLFQKTPAEIDAEVQKVMSCWGGSPGLALSGGCELAYKTPVENIKALKEATEKYGRMG